MADVTQVTLSPNALRRLARLQARAEGANSVAQVAINAAQQAHQTLQQALTEECQDEGMTLDMTTQAQAEVDWRTGVVRLAPPVSTEPMGVIALPPGNGAAPEHSAEPV